MHKSKFVSSLFFTLFFLPLQSWAANVEIALVDRLDGDLEHYCIDISGGFQNIDPSRGLQAHTCLSYRGESTPDQTLDPSGFADGQFKYPEFDVCASLPSTEAGTKVALSACDGSDVQSLVFSENGTISPKAALDMCLTVGEETTFGRNGTSPHQIKELTLQSCSDELASRQQWEAREEKK